MFVFHFAADNLRDGTPLPKQGAKLPPRRAELCVSGWHGSERVTDALRYAPGTRVCLREMCGIIRKGDDKACASEARQHTRYVDARPLLEEFAQWCADRAARAAYAAIAARGAYAASAARAAARAAAIAATAARGAYAASAADRAARAARAAYVARAAYAAYARVDAAERRAQEKWLAPRIRQLLGV